MSLKNLLSYEWKIRILLFLMKFKKNRYFQPTESGLERKMYIFLTADYGNLGDVAISYAQNDFVSRNFPDIEIIDVPISKTVEGIDYVQKNIRKGDLVGINGGGNFGPLYADIETLRQLVVESFPDNRVIGFPMTIDHSEEEHEKQALRKAKSRYSRHKSLVLMAREKRSFQTMKKFFPSTQVYLSPDIVMSLNKSEPKKERKGLVICMRNDVEKKLNAEQDAVLHKLIAQHFENHSIYDTHIGRGNLSMAERRQELDKIWSAFRGAKLVITDRLHGMIFCYITGTPCLVFLNNNFKIQDSYEWIKSAPNITLLSEFKEDVISEHFRKAELNQGSAPSPEIQSQYQDLLKAFYPEPF